MKKVRFLIILFIILLALTNCVSLLSEEPPSATQNGFDTSATIKSTQTPTQNPSTQTPVPSPTWTHLPTLSLGEAEKAIAKLLVSNGGCELPCWWGMIPGETRWDEAEQFLNTFTTSIGQGQQGTHQEDDGYHFHTNYTVHYIISGHTNEGLALFSIRDGIIIGIDIDSPGNEFDYQLYQLLSSYGLPQAVYVLTYPNVPFDVLPFRILIHYSNQGIYAIYEYPAENDGNTITSCPDASGPSLHLDSPNQPYKKYLMPFEDSAKRLMGVNENNLLVDLQTATQMDITTFYETFKNPEVRECLKTPTHLW